MSLSVNPIETGKKIWEVFKIIQELGDEYKKDIAEVKQANALLVLLRRMAAKETSDFDFKEFKRILPHTNLNWAVRRYNPSDDSSFIIDFKPDPALVDWCHRPARQTTSTWLPAASCSLEPKQVGVNLGALKQLPNLAIVVVYGRDANEIEQPQRAKEIVEWMGKQEDELTMAYGLRAREQAGR